MTVGFGLHYSCSSIAGMDWPDLYQAAIDQAKLAEELGFECAVVSEHHFKVDGWIPSPLVLCGAIAATTTRLRVGSDIIILPLHNPISVAEDILVLDNLSRGRAICGVGMGARADEFDVFGVPFKQRVSRSEESMILIRRLMAERDVTHEGRYFKTHRLTVTPRPVQKPAPPLWYGAISEPGARRAARFADELIIGPGPDFDEVRRIQQAHHDELERLGKDSTRARLILRRESFLARDSETAWSYALAPLKFQFSKIYSDFDPEGTDAEFREFSRNRFVVGSPSECLEQVKKYVEAVNVGLFLFRIQLPGLSSELVYEATRLLGEEVFPYVNS